MLKLIALRGQLAKMNNLNLYVNFWSQIEEHLSHDQGL
jgi:hypothetical protein